MLHESLECDHSVCQARGILQRLNNEGERIDIEETLAAFRSQGGYCDCEIRLNVILTQPDRIDCAQ